MNNFLHRQYSNDYKLKTYLKIARLYLENEDPVQAEAYINRASLLQADSQNEELQIYYKVTHQLLYTRRMIFFKGGMDMSTCLHALAREFLKKQLSGIASTF